MISELFIDNFVIIKRQHIFFEEGFNVLTGETGSGKSLILNSINMLLGKRANKDIIGKFEDRTIIEGVFILDKDLLDVLKEKGLIFDDNKLIITRTIEKLNSTIRINGRLSNLSMLKEISEYLIDIYKQGDSNIFMNKNNYLNILDSYTGDENTIELRKKIKEFNDKKLKAIDKYKNLDISEEEVQRELDLISYQIEDLSELDLENLNEEELYLEYKKLSSLSELKEAIEKSQEYLSSYEFDTPSVGSMLEEISSQIGQYENFDKKIKDLSEFIIDIIDQVNEFYSDLDSYKETLDQNPERLDELESINQKIFDLKRKYGNSIEQIIAYREKIQDRYDELNNLSKLRKSIKNNIDEYDKILNDLSVKLHLIRDKKAQQLEKSIDKAIKSLNIKNGKFKVFFEKKYQIDSTGYDKIDFLIKTNKGEELNSLSKTASGGEISRIMLSFKKIFADFDQYASMIFDEIDQGISGRTAQIVGEKILDLSQKRQIIAISHLPQIASLSNNHILIEKKDIDDYTISTSKTIKNEDRVEEIARLIAGVDITETNKKSAKEMLLMAEKLRKES